MITIIAEKPSVAQGIAAIVNSRKREDGFWSGNGYAVTWAYGHLITLASPEAYGFQAHWSVESLPMIPGCFRIVPIASKDKKSTQLYAKQIKTICSLFKKSEKIIVATDAGREGELIFRYIYYYLQEHFNVRTPFERLWISSLTDKAILDGLAHLKPGSDYDHMYEAGRARSEADWLIGLNGTRSITLNVNDGTLWSVGRVQTPTLAMICRRYIEHRDFVPKPYFMLRGQTSKGGHSFFGLHATRFDDRGACEQVCADVLSQAAFRVVKVEKKPAFSNPPLLFDLTSIQKEANSRYGFSAELTLNLCQALYEKKLTTYPRTGSRYIPEDVYETLPMLITNLASYPRFAQYAASLSGANLCRISVNDAKVTDHHALLPTENKPKSGDMNESERKIYELIAGRLLETVSPREEKEVTTAILIPGDLPSVPFVVKGTVIIKPGWRAVMRDEIKSDEEENPVLPTLQEGEQLPIQEVLLLEKTTKAPPLLTENTLLSLMETAGKELENEEEREAMKNIGIGTPATRADIIEKLLSTKYVVREKKNLVPTEKGLSLYHLVKDMGIADVSMTGKWENALNKISEGKVSVDKFNEEIRKYAVSITGELLKAKVFIRPGTSVSSTPGTRIAGQVTKEFKCPKCGSGLVVTDKVCYCREKEACGFLLWRVVAGRRLSEKDLTQLLEEGQTKGKVKLKKKDGKNFEARLALDKDGKIVFKWD